VEGAVFCDVNGREYLIGIWKWNGLCVFIIMPGTGTRVMIFELPDPRNCKSIPLALLTGCDDRVRGGQDLKTNGAGL
jgi:hypothetical protein